jgi:endoglucanase
VDTKHISQTAQLGVGVPLLATLLAVSSACIMPGKTPAVGNAGEAFGSCGADGLIDDGEDGNNQSKATGGRGGYWYTFMDKTKGTTVTPEAGAEGGIFTMSPGGVNGSKYAVNVKGRVGRGQVVFGAVGMNFTDPMGMYDASQYKGIAFWAKKGPSSYGKVRFKVPDASTHEAGGVCTECFNDFGADLVLTESWQHFVFPWRKLKQLPDWGQPKPHAIKPGKLFGLQWQVNQPGADFDIWIDDVEFIGCE